MINHLYHTHVYIIEPELEKHLNDLKPIEIHYLHLNTLSTKVKKERKYH